MTFFSNLLLFLGGLLSLFSKNKDHKAGKTEAQKEAAEATVTVLKAQAEACTNAPKKKKQLLDLLRSGKASLLLMFIISACNGAAVSTCLTLQEWSLREQDELAANLSTIPENSPIISMATDWARMRAETKACIANTR